MAITYTKGYYNDDSKYVTEVVTIAEGATLKVWKDSIQVMSDVWEMGTLATYWDDVKGCLQTIQWVSKADVDATPAVLEKVKAFLYAKAYNNLYQQRLAEANTMKKGNIVKVKSGKTAKGLVGKVVVQIERPYLMGWKSVMSTKFGIAGSDEKVEVVKNGKVYENYKDVIWVWAKNCEIVDVPAVDIEEVKESAANVAEWDFKKVYKAA